MKNNFNCMTDEQLEQVWLCSQCDLVVKKKTLKPGDQVYCPACGYKIFVERSQSVHVGMILSMIGIILILPAMYLPILNMHIFTEITNHSVISGVKEFISQGMWFPALFIIFGVVLCPALYLCLNFIIMFSIQYKIYHQCFTYLVKGIQIVRHWIMLEVYLFGLLVAGFKLSDLANIHIKTGFFAFLGLIACELSVAFFMNTKMIWNELERLKKLT